MALAKYCHTACERVTMFSARYINVISVAAAFVLNPNGELFPWKIAGAIGF